MTRIEKLQNTQNKLITAINTIVDVLENNTTNISDLNENPRGGGLN